MTSAQTIAAVTHHWLVGVAWRMRRNCDCPKCHAGMIDLLAATARLMVAVKPSAVEERPS